MVLTRLKEVRNREGLSVEALAVKSGVSSMTIRRAEKGRGVMLNNARAIAKALKMSIGDFV